jgi:hypothetical protein
VKIKFFLNGGSAMKKSRMYWSVVLLVVAGLLLGGCASNQPSGTSLSMKVDEKSIKDLTVLPYQSLGVEATSNIEAGNATIVEAPSSKKMVGEEGLGRIRWNGWAVNPKTGKEFFVQFVKVGMYKTGKFRYNVIIDGKENEISSKTKIIALGSRCNRVFVWNGGIIDIDRNLFHNSWEYRAKIVLEYGMSIADRYPDQEFMTEVKSWYQYKTKEEGYLYSPYSETDMIKIVRINPGYTLMEVAP